MIRSLWIAKTGLDAQQTQLDVISNNLANVGTNGFKRARVAFEDLLYLNPYHSVPTLVDRDLVLYDSRVIIDYLDERFPHPPLMPIDPITRAQFRVALYRLERDWYGLAREIEVDPAAKAAAQSRKVLTEAISASAEVFKAKPFFLSDEFSLVEASIGRIGRKISKPTWRSPSSPSVIAIRAIRVRSPDSISARRAIAAGTPAATITAPQKASVGLWMIVFKVQATPTRM
jgi:glutathione S-transferase